LGGGEGEGGAKLRGTHWRPYLLPSISPPPSGQPH
jgi:hypothetical protein